jgi:tRNA G18 (ribose-2'-O)-methylase SpoU
MHSTIIALDNIRSHHNVGAIFRSADAFGIKEVILGGITPRPPHRDIQKSALGATESVTWSYSEKLLERLQTLKNQGYALIAVEQTVESVPIYSLTPEGGQICLILGNEVNGVDSAILEICDQVLEIPQVGIKKSLNVSVCAGIVMFYFNKSLDLPTNT